MSSSEAVLGEIPVVTRLTLGSERLSLFVTSSRFLVAHVGKRGVGAAVSVNILGKLSAALEDLLKTSKESVGKRRMRSLGVREILAANKENFFISFDEVVSVTVSQGARLTGLTILTGRDKFEFSTRIGFDNVVELLRGNLGRKLTVKRIG